MLTIWSVEVLCDNVCSLQSTFVGVERRQHRPLEDGLCFKIGIDYFIL